jgi:NhaA family Na+:H+ antiporter
VFALFAAGVPLGADALREVFTSPIPLGVMAGLLVGKVVGILGFAALTIRITPAARPRGLGWRDMAAVSTLGGVGFTVSLLIAELSLGGQPEVLDSAKAAVLIASAAASLVGAALLVRRGRAHAEADDAPEASAPPA